MGKSIFDKIINPTSESEKIKQGLQRFKMDMMKHKPFYGDILMRVRVYEDYKIPTAATDGRCIRYNPKFFATLTVGERNYVFMHEVMHMLLLHWKRVGGRDPQIWNVACDFVVNGLLDRMHWSLVSDKLEFKRPKMGCFVDGYYRGESAEEFYRKLCDENKNRKGTGKMAIVCNGRSLGQLPTDLEKALTAVVTEGENGNQELIEKEIRDLIKDVVKRRGLGDSYYVPKEIMKLSEAKKLPWHRLLHEFLEERVDEESSYLTPERKYLHMDLIIPGLSRIDDELGEIWAFVDSSGSIGGVELNIFMTQLYRISKEFSCVFNIAFWDTQVTDVYRHVKNSKEVLECKPLHSGGTDINCVYNYIKENKIKPGVMIILTDGYYGELKEPAGKLKSRTILVVSENGAVIEKDNGIGKLARL